MLDEVLDGGRLVDAAAGVGQSQGDRRAGAARLVLAATAAAAGRRGERRGRGEDERREPASILIPSIVSLLSWNIETTVRAGERRTSWLARESDCGQHECARRERCHNRAVARVPFRPANLARLAAGAVALVYGLGALAARARPGRAHDLRRALRPRCRSRRRRRSRARGGRPRHVLRPAGGADR